MNDTFASIGRLRDLGHIRAEYHPTLLLTVVKYSDTFARRGLWDRRMLGMRGAVYDDTGRCVSQPLRKFFNLGEKPAPSGTYRVQRKLDGTCVCAFRYQGIPVVHTLGSFVSAQAAAAWAHIEAAYGWDWLPELPGLTFQFEWLDADNFTTLRHVGEPRLVLLAVLHDGREVFTGAGWERFVAGERCAFWRGPVVDTVAHGEVDALAASVPDDEEGYVLVYDRMVGGQYPRMKIKGQRYLALGRAKWNLTDLLVWRMTFETPDAEPDLLDQLDEEALAWYRQRQEWLRTALRTMKRTAARHVERIERTVPGHDRQRERLAIAGRSDIPEPYRQTVFRVLRGHDMPIDAFVRALRPTGGGDRYGGGP